jgi:hypothetical protein
MISITSTAFDPLGYIAIDPLPGSSEDSYSRRVTRTATLDGGVAISDRGYSDGDRTLVYRYKSVSTDHDARAKRILRLHPTVQVSTPDGVYLAAPESFDARSDENTISLLVIRKLSED